MAFVRRIEKEEEDEKVLVLRRKNLKNKTKRKSIRKRS